MANKVNLDISERLDITCKRGDTFSLGLLLKDSAGTAITLSTSGYTFLMQVKGDPLPDGSDRELIMGTTDQGRSATKVNADRVEVATNFTVTVDDDGNATFTATSEAMQLIEAGNYVYDIQQTVNSVATTILEGQFTVNDDISNPTL